MNRLERACDAFHRERSAEAGGGSVQRLGPADAARAGEPPDPA